MLPVSNPAQPIESPDTVPVCEKKRRPWISKLTELPPAVPLRIVWNMIGAGR